MTMKGARQYTDAVRGKAVLLLIMSVAGLVGCRPPGETERAALKTVAEVDLQRYAGRWYELARIPNRFQRKCASAATAEYGLRDDGRIDVINRCRDRHGERVTANGIARVTDPDSNAKLEVSFVSFLGWRPFWGDYWIIGLDPEYRWAAVGHPERSYGWLLAREPQVGRAQREAMIDAVERAGYRLKDFEWVAAPHSDATAAPP